MDAMPAPVRHADPMVPRPFRITRVIREIDGVFTWRLAAVDGAPFDFRPGQFNMVTQFGVGEIPVSISGDCRRPETLVHTIRAVGPVTEAMQGLRAGAIVGIRGPFGRPWPIDAAIGSDVIFVTSTIGLAPLRPLILEVLHRRQDFGKVVICYGTRGIHDIMFEEDLHAWRARFDTNVHLTVHSAPSGYRGRVGGVAAAIHAARIDGPATVAFVCRSEALTRQAVNTLGERGVTPDRVWVTLERNMKCGIGLCGHCQFGPSFMCKDGPVYRFDEIEALYSVREF
ncbi:MAG: FAD/NAD(P)-binding protein [Rhodospirillales bacterium]|nr:FAD/NAD(P)-binding protein [Rhodospirillales bacterium]